MTFQLPLGNKAQPRTLANTLRTTMISNTPLPEQLGLLLVDDEEFNLKSLKRLFRGQGFEIHTALDGFEALNILDSKNIAIVISDMHMPKLSGLDFLKKARERHPETQLIVLTGYAEFAEAIDVLNSASIFKYLTKPWDDAYLLSAVHEAAAVYWGKLMDYFVESSTLEHNEQLKYTNKRLKHSIEQSQAQNLKITEKLHSAYEGEKQLRKERREAQRLSQAKSQFLATMSHEIRTPLNAIIATNTLLLESELNSEQLSLVKMSLNGGQTLLSLINDILDFSKISSGKFEFNEDWFNLIEMIEATCNLVSGQLANKEVDIAVIIEPETPNDIYGDKKRVTQLLNNLLSNAIKFTDEGCITVTASFHKVLILEVKDTGIGIPREKINAIFDEFTQVDDTTTASQGGTGLGLSICKKLCHLMDGSIEVTSEHGKGSAFTLKLPLASNNPIQFPVFDDPSEPLLLLSQNTNLHKSLEKQLSFFNCRLAICSEAPRDMNEYSAIIYDLDTLCFGKKRLNDIHKNNKQKHFALIGTNGADQQQELKRYGFTDVLRKPLGITALVNLLIDQLERKPNNQQLNADQLELFQRWQTPSAEPHPIEQFDLAGARILLAEDSPSNQAIFLNILAKMNAKVDIACNGIEAVAFAERNLYALILMDVRMPEMDGLSASRSITQGTHFNRKTPIIALTANAYDEDKNVCFEAGMSDFLSKPIDIKQFRECIVQWCLMPDLPQNDGSASAHPSIQEMASSDQLPSTLIDLKIIEQLEKDTSTDILPTLLTIFAQETEKRLADITEIQQAGDWDALAEQAHTLKSSAGSFGAKDLQNAALQLESRLSNCEYAEIETNMANFTALGHATIAAINTLQQQRKS